VDCRILGYVTPPVRAKRLGESSSGSLINTLARFSCEVIDCQQVLGVDCNLSVEINPYRWVRIPVQFDFYR
jgi:hypothetical protein